MGVKLSPSTSSIFLIHPSVSRSTVSSSSSCNSLINGNISGNNASHSSPSRFVRLRWHCTAAKRTAGISDRVYFNMIPLSVLWWFGESAAAASSVTQGISSEVNGILAACLNWSRRAAVTGVKWAGDCQNPDRCELGHESCGVLNGSYRLDHVQSISAMFLGLLSTVISRLSLRRPHGRESRLRFQELGQRSSSRLTTFTASAILTATAEIASIP